MTVALRQVLLHCTGRRTVVKLHPLFGHGPFPHRSPRYMHSVGYAAKSGIHRLPPTALVVNFASRMDIEKLTLIVDEERLLLPNPAGTQ